MKKNLNSGIVAMFCKQVYGKDFAEEDFIEWWKNVGNKHFEKSLNKNETILEEANSIIFDRNEEKNRKYGPFIESMERSALFASLLCNKEITTEDFYKCMIALKISRLSYNGKRDTILDGIGYLAGLNEFYEKANERLNDLPFKKECYIEDFEGYPSENCQNCGKTFGYHKPDPNQ